MCGLASIAAAVALCGGVAAATKGAPEPGPNAAQLLAKTSRCTQVSHGKYRTDQGARPTVRVCVAGRAVFWKADMDIDCDGARTARCNESTDPWFQDDTFVHASRGEPLNAERLPYVVIPIPSSTFDYRDHGIEPGAVVAVIRGRRVVYAVFGDTGPRRIIGEASYATARRLGIDPDPRTGGTDATVTYIAFKHTSVSPVESPRAAVRLGRRLARDFARSGQ
jgi:hypothetical protein